jgi:hypothetical protein
MPEDLDPAFFAERLTHVAVLLGYVVWRRWKDYGEEGLAGRHAALWLRERTLTLEHAGEPLRRYAMESSPDTRLPVPRRVPFSSGP